MSGRHKQPFSVKQKKKQLQEKRAAKRAANVPELDGADTAPCTTMTRRDKRAHDKSVRINAQPEGEKGDGMW